MSIRTAIEINHDHFRKQNVEKAQLIEMLLQAVYQERPEDWDALRLHYGIQLVYRCHHTDDRVDAHKAQRSALKARSAP